MSDRILVVEDEPKIANLLRRGLLYEGYTVDVAVDGENGLQMARDTPPDLVILDIMLPGIDGLEVCRELRARGHEVPIVLVTGWRCAGCCARPAMSPSSC